MLLTDQKFGDIELMLDAKPDWGVCSGLFVRCTERGEAYQFMVDYHDNGNVGHVHGELSGSFNNRPFLIDGIYDKNKKLIRLKTKPSGLQVPEAYSISGEDWVRVWKIGEWNTLKIRIVGDPPMITTWINGAKVSEFDGTTYDGPGYGKEKVAKLLGDKGSIGLQVHGGGSWPVGAKCRWKNIRVKMIERGE